MLVDVIYIGVKICALVSVCAYGWLKVRQERKAAKSACKNCYSCRMVRADGKVVCELEEEPIEQPISCALFAKWSKDDGPNLCVYCKHCQTYNSPYVYCNVNNKWRNIAKVTCGYFE